MMISTFVLVFVVLDLDGRWQLSALTNRMSGLPCDDRLDALGDRRLCVFDETAARLESEWPIRLVGPRQGP